MKRVKALQFCGRACELNVRYFFQPGCILSEANTCLRFKNTYRGFCGKKPAVKKNRLYRALRLILGTYLLLMVFLSFRPVYFFFFSFFSLYLKLNVRVKSLAITVPGKNYTSFLDQCIFKTKEIEY